MIHMSSLHVRCILHIVSCVLYSTVTPPETGSRHRQGTSLGFASRRVPFARNAWSRRRGDRADSEALLHKLPVTSSDFQPNCLGVLGVK